MQELSEDGSGAFEVLLLLRFEVETWTVAEKHGEGAGNSSVGVTIAGIVDESNGTVHPPVSSDHSDRNLPLWQKE